MHGKATFGIVLFITAFLTACGGGNDDQGKAPSHSATEENPDAEGALTQDQSPVDIESFFSQSVQPHLGYCRTCHQPGGVADTSDGRRFQLTLDRTQDYQKVQTAWGDLGAGTENNLILLKNAPSDETHTGGKTWPRSGNAYLATLTLFQCWDDASRCPSDDTTTDTPETPDDDPVNTLPLLGSSHGEHLWESACNNQPDSTPLPPDPRSEIVAGANAGKAVFFNAYYEDCHVNLPESEQAPTTCGEYRERVAQGDWFLNRRAAMTDFKVPASSLHGLWEKWGYSERPENFDALLTERYGLNPAPYPNPYPLPGEDPVLSDGGSGQLPMGLIQVKDGDGLYTGKVTINCYICHGGMIGATEDGPGLGPIPGMGNTNTDVMLLFRDLSSGLVGNLPISLGSVRGTSNAVGAFDMLTMIWDVDTLGLAINPFKLPWSHPYHGNQDMPNWWNSSHRPRKFFDGGLSVDSTRIDMAAADQLNLMSQSGAERRRATETYDQYVQAYVDAQVAPPFPGQIDEALAKQGAILFHTKDLWAEAGNESIPRPSGNGSCAGCHGAYSPRFVNDPNYLEKPQWEGIAAHIVPLDIIGTDPARALSIPDIVRESFSSTWWGYPDGAEGYVPPEEKGFWEEIIDEFANPDINPEGRPVQGACNWETGTIGYLAPPLYGVWASSPYFHNGSVPTLRQVLKPGERPEVWERYSTPGDAPVKGFDMSLNLYDLTDQVGWEHRTYCSSEGGLSAQQCEPENTYKRPGIYRWLDGLKEDIWLFGFLSEPYATPEQIERRKIYNTHEFGNSNGGHEFTNVLTNAEVAALIEYMKTL